MTSTENMQALPIWVWLTFVILVIGIVMIIYSRGNWRQTTAFMVIALFAVLIGEQSSHFQAYINTHFIGGYDQLGIPFKQGGPGWSLLWISWPLWIIPVFITALLTFGISLLWRTPKYHKPPAPNLFSAVTPSLPNQKLNVIKDELETALKSVEQVSQKNQELELNLLLNKNESSETINELKNKISVLVLDVEAKEMQKQQLLESNLQQTEKISRLNIELNKLKNNP